jgi:hypothetical protein
MYLVARLVLRAGSPVCLRSAAASVRRVTIDDLEFLAYRGLIKPRFRGGKYIGSRQKPDNSALLKLLERFDRLTVRLPFGG